jgi:hypothetical protein
MIVAINNKINFINKENIKMEKEYNVDLKIVKKYDDMPPYIRLVNKIIRDGEGRVSIKEEKNDLAGIYASGSAGWMIGLVWVPKAALRPANEGTRKVYYCQVCGWESFNEEDKNKPCGQTDCKGVLNRVRSETYAI